MLGSSQQVWGTLVCLWASGLSPKMNGGSCVIELPLERERESKEKREQRKKRNRSSLSPQGRAGDARPRDHGRRALEASR